MRVTTLFRKLLGVTELLVTDLVSWASGALMVEARPRWLRSRCGGCGKSGPRYDRRPQRYWRHLSLGRTPIWIGYSPWRVDCGSCGIRTEQVPWAAAGSRFTWAFEEMVAYLAQITDHTTVTALTGIAWPTVGSIVERVVARRLSADRLKNLSRIGIDEFSYRKRHRYVTVVVDHDRQRVVWAAEGRSAEVLGSFFSSLGAERRAEIRFATIDMSGGYQKAIAEWLPNAKIVFDRFHVQQLASNAVDEVRRQLVRDVAGTEDAKAIKNTRFVLLKRPGDLTAPEKERLSDVQRTNHGLYRAYLLKEMLVAALNCRQPADARRMMEAWLGWASRSKLPPFVRVARTIRQRLDGVLAYVKTRLTNGLAEGFNNKIRVVARRAYGFHSADALISMIFLNCGGIQLDPPLPAPTPS
jgi:transposase